MQNVVSWLLLPISFILKVCMFTAECLENTGKIIPKSFHLVNILQYFLPFFFLLIQSCTPCPYRKYFILAQLALEHS